MRIFLTGGSGYVGSAVLDAFVRAGHQVDALVRNSEKAAVVQARGGHPLLGDLSEPATYADAAAAADGVVHTASSTRPAERRSMRRRSGRCWRRAGTGRASRSTRRACGSSATAPHRRMNPRRSIPLRSSRGAPRTNSGCSPPRPPESGPS